MKTEPLTIEVKNEEQLEELSRAVHEVKLAQLARNARVYDPEKKSVTEMPIAELAPGMVQVNMGARLGHVWVSQQWLSKNTKPIKGFFHPPFNEQLRGLIREKIMPVFIEVYPRTLEEWEDGFRKDVHAEEEIGLWLVLAQRYADFIRSHPLLKPARREALKLMLHATMVPHKKAFFSTLPVTRFLKRKQVEALAAMFEKNWLESQ